MTSEQVQTIMSAISPWIPGSEWKMVRDILEGVDLPMEHMIKSEPISIQPSPAREPFSDEAISEWHNRMSGPDPKTQAR